MSLSSEKEILIAGVAGGIAGCPCKKIRIRSDIVPWRLLLGCQSVPCTSTSLGAFVPEVAFLGLVPVFGCWVLPC